MACIISSIPPGTFPIVDDAFVTALQTLPTDSVIFCVNPYFDFARTGFAIYYVTAIGVHE
jgi:hypothetical protein